MSIFTFHVHQHTDNTEVLKELKNIVKILSHMATKEEIKAEFRAALDEITSATDNLAADIERLATKAEGGLTLEEAGGFSAELREKAARLRGVADITPEDEAPQG